MSVVTKFSIPYGKQTIDASDVQAVADAVSAPLMTTGPQVKAFEEALCDYTGANYCVAVSNGTAALHLASLALLNKGDAVLTTPNSFLATSNAILYAKAKPIFVDIDTDGNIDLDVCEKELKKNPNIKAIYGVAFSGNMLNQKKLKYLRENYPIMILEDNAHAIGARQGNIKAGSCENSDMAIFSFHPVKNITTGEGGAIMTNDKAYHDSLLSLRNHGMIKTPDMAPWEYEMRELGYNYRLTDIQAALGLNQLKKLDSFLDKRRAIAKRYHDGFKGTKIEPLYPFSDGSAYHLFVVQVDYHDKRELFEKLLAKGVGVQLHYMPINKQPYYKDLGYGAENTPMMDRYHDRALSLPMYPLLSEGEQEYVIEMLKSMV